eukprot:scaffold280629_cov36-Tisochrysis_lutea.AAC.2
MGVGWARVRCLRHHSEQCGAADNKECICVHGAVWAEWVSDDDDELEHDAPESIRPGEGKGRMGCRRLVPLAWYCAASLGQANAPS